MKNLIVVNGPMGVGKTTICRQLYMSLENLVWLDGDWCWMMHPWNITDENKKMVMENVQFLLRAYLSNSSFEYVVFSWVIHKQEILDEILSGLIGLEFSLFKFTITCSEQELIRRLKEANRSGENIRDSVSRLRQYDETDATRIDTTDSAVTETVEAIVKVVTASG